MTPRLLHKGVDQSSTNPAALALWWYSDRADLREMSPVEVKSPTSDDLTVFLSDHEISNVLAEFRNAARKQYTLASVGLDDRVNMLHIGERGTARSQSHIEQ